MESRLGDASLTVLLTTEADGRDVLRRALSWGEVAPGKVRVVMVEDEVVRFDGSLEAFCTRPDGTRDEPESAYLRRMFEADLLPQ